MPVLTPEIFDFRVERLQEMGFDRTEATILAQARDSARNLVDLHGVERLLAAGCGTETAYRIYA